MTKVSIITTCLNCEKTIRDTIESVLGQKYQSIEYIIIDGGSRDATLDIIKSYGDKITYVSEKDEGMYFALNKGIERSTGDIVGIINADDVYIDFGVIELIADEMERGNCDVCWGDLIYSSEKDKNKVVRYWKSSKYSERNVLMGWMPPHPTFFVKKAIYEKYGTFNTHLTIAADYEIMLRFLFKNQIKSSYIPQVLVNMRMGGVSNRSIKTVLQKMKEDYAVMRMQNLRYGILVLLFKNVIKLPQFFIRNNKKER